MERLVDGSHRVVDRCSSNLRPKGCRRQEDRDSRWRRETCGINWTRMEWMAGELNRAKVGK